MIGRAEQADVPGGMNSAYAYANYCPDSFFDGWVTPGEAHRLLSNETQICFPHSLSLAVLFAIIRSS